VSGPVELQQLNTMPAAEFVAHLAGIFEHSPWVAERAAATRPFASREALLEAMRAIVDAAAPDEQMALIRAHPQLGARGLAQATLTAASASEQRGAGLLACTPADFARLDELNATYLRKFGMPFIMAVRGHDHVSIIAHFEARLAHDAADERRAALREIGLIAGFRLADAVTAD
jgi:OHCU decarboxylase